MLGDSKLIITLFFASFLCLTPFYSTAQQKSKDQLRKEKKAAGPDYCRRAVARRAEDEAPPP